MKNIKLFRNCSLPSPTSCGLSAGCSDAERFLHPAAAVKPRDIGEGRVVTLVLLLFFITLILSGCLYQATGKNMPSKAAVHQCLLRCQAHYSACRQTCENNCSNCQKQAWEKAALDYTRYAHQVKIAGDYNVRQLKSYRDPLQCRKTTCNCRVDLLNCKQACTGNMLLQAAPYCT